MRRFQRLLLLADRPVVFLLELLLVVFLLDFLPAERFLLLAAAFFAFSAAFRFLVRAAFLAAARRCAFVCAMFRMKGTRHYVVKVSYYQLIFLVYSSNQMLKNSFTNIYYNFGNTIFHDILLCRYHKQDKPKTESRLLRGMQILQVQPFSFLSPIPTPL